MGLYTSSSITSPNRIIKIYLCTGKETNAFSLYLFHINVTFNVWIKYDDF
jgi:hypothetical protein